MNRPATMRGPSKAPIDIVLRNLSETGALLEAEKTFPVGTLIGVGISGAGFHVGRVRRLTPHGMAIEFLSPLDAAAVARAKKVDTIVSMAFPQMLIQPARATDLASAQPVRTADISPIGPSNLLPGHFSDAWTKAAPWASWAAVTAVVLALVASLLM